MAGLASVFSDDRDSTAQVMDYDAGILGVAGFSR